MDQKRRFKPTREDVLLYLAFTCIANYLVATAVSLLSQWFIVDLGAPVVYPFLCIGSFAGTLALFWWRFRERIFAQYRPGMQTRDLIRGALLTVLPGEALRFLLSLVTLGSAGLTGGMSLAATVLFERTYLTWAGRYDAVRAEGAVALSDVFAYILCYLLYLSVYLLAVIGIYWLVWRARKKERAQLGAEL